jgi:hypothetical protein
VVFQQSNVAVGVTADGVWVFDRADSHIHRGVEQLLADAIAAATLGGREFLTHCVDFRRTIGLSTCVPTSPGDQIIYAVRRGRTGYSRFVLGRQPVPSPYLTVVLRRGPESREGTATLVTAFVGRPAAREPFDPRATDEDVAFWREHALVWDEEEIVLGTICAAPPRG